MHPLERHLKHPPWDKPTAQEMTPFVILHAQLRRRQTDQHVGLQTDAFDVAFLNIPPRRDVHRYDRQFGSRNET
jgi:hypothetical protein